MFVRFEFYDKNSKPGNFERLYISETSKKILSLITLKSKYEITNNGMKN